MYSGKLHDYDKKFINNLYILLHRTLPRSAALYSKNFLFLGFFRVE